MLTVDPQQFKQILIMQVRELMPFADASDLPRLVDLVAVMTAAPADDPLIECVRPILFEFISAIVEGKPIDPRVTIRAVLSGCAS